MSDVLRAIQQYKNEIERLRRENYRLRLEIGKLIEENAKLRKLLTREDGF